MPEQLRWLIQAKALHLTNSSKAVGPSLIIYKELWFPVRTTEPSGVVSRYNRRNQPTAGTKQLRVWSFWSVPPGTVGCSREARRRHAASDVINTTVFSHGHEVQPEENHEPRILFEKHKFVLYLQRRRTPAAAASVEPLHTSRSFKLWFALREPAGFLPPDRHTSNNSQVSQAHGATPLFMPVLPWNNPSASRESLFLRPQLVSSCWCSQISVCGGEMCFRDVRNWSKDVCMSRKPQQSGTISMKLVRRFLLKTGIKLLHRVINHKSSRGIQPACS